MCSTLNSRVTAPNFFFPANPWLSFLCGYFLWREQVVYSAICYVFEGSVVLDLQILGPASALQIFTPGTDQIPIDLLMICLSGEADPWAT